MRQKERASIRTFESIFGRNGSEITSQIDNQCELFGAVLDAEFVGIYYGSATSSEYMPVTLRSFLESKAGIKSPGNCWDHAKYSNASIEMPVGLYKCSDKSAQLSDTERAFASENSFNYRHLRSHRYANGSRIVVCAYWNKEPDCMKEKCQHITEILADSLGNFLSLMEDINVNDHFMVRLLRLLQVFDTRLDDCKIESLLELLVNSVSGELGIAGAILLERESAKSDLTLVETEKADDRRQNVSRLVKTVNADISSNERLMANLNGLRRIDTGHFADIQEAVLIDISPDTGQQYFILVWTDENGEFHETDLELLSTFAFFARTVLSNLYLVTMLREANKAQRKSSLRMANLETLAALADMTSGLAHDFNNIIGGVVGRVQLLKMSCTDQPVQEGLNKIEQLVLDGAKTVKRIQEFVTSSKYKNMEPVDLCQIIDDAVNNKKTIWARDAAQRKIEINTRFAIEPAIISGFAPDLVTAIDKIIENAVEYAPDGTSITIALEADSKSYRLHITDQGKGISGKHLNRIFYPFFSTKRTRGAGMSLATVHGIIIRHGGKIKAARAPGQGTTITIMFQRPTSPDEISDFTKTDRVNKDLNILVVDDDLEIREVLGDLLTMEGHRSTICPDGYSALEVFRKDNFDLMITDLGMPGMSGLELAAIIHAEDPNLPIAMITGWGTQLNDKEIKQMGVVSIISKPFHLAEIRMVIADLTQTERPIATK